MILIDSKLFPYIEEAESGSYEVMAELFEMFTYGDNDILPNYEFAKRYSSRLHSKNLEVNDPKMIATMHNQFENYEEAAKVLLECFTYTVKNLPVEQWEPQVIKIFAENLEAYQGAYDNT